MALGDNSIKISATGGGTGAVIEEIYGATPANRFSATTPRLVNVSVLKHLGTSLTVGFVVSGSGVKRLLVRAIGPTLGTAQAVGGALSDPQLTLYSGETAIARNDNWGGTPALKAAFVSAAAFDLPDASRDAATVVTLQPGNYTAVVSGVGNTTGIVLVEVYELPALLGTEPVVTTAGLVLIPAGTFTMGDSKNEGIFDELPTHSVTLSAFYLQQTEVTFARGLAEF